MDKNADKYSAAEKRAYYMGFGVGRCGLSIDNDKVQNMICYSCKDEKRLKRIYAVLAHLLFIIDF